METEIQKENEEKKEYLRSYRRAVKREKDILDEIQRLRTDKMFPSVVNDGMPRGSSQSDLSDYIAILDEQIELLKTERLEKARCYQKIERQIKQMENEDEQEVLRLRYITGLKWEEVAVRMSYSWKHIHRMSGVMRMYEKLKTLKDKLQKMKSNRANRQTGQTFHFSPFSRKQKQVLTWWCKESPVHDMDGVIADGAIRSGKTISMSLSFVMWAMSTFTGQNFAMCGKTIGSFRRNVLFWLKLMLRSRGYSITDHRADNLLTIRKDGKENYFYIFGGKDERSQDLIQGITLAGVFFDEVALMPESFVNQATGRCSVKGSKFWFNCNPDGPYHWFKQNWIDKSTGYLGKEETARRMQQAAAEGKDPGLKDILYLHFTMDDNLSLDEEIKARYRSMYVGVFFKRYIMGLWAAAEGIIYDMFDENKHVQDIKDFYQLLINGNRYVSCDYGTQNATVFLLWNKGTNGKWYCIREYYYSGRDKGKQKTDSEYADDLKEWLDGTKIKAIIVDPSAASFIAELRKRGYKVLKANNDVLDGIRLVGMLLNLEKIVFASSCKETIKEFASYIWDEKALERGEDKPVKQFDHCCDAVRYLCSTIIGRKAARFREIRR